MRKRVQLAATLAVFALLFGIGATVIYEPRVSVPGYEYLNHGWPLPWISEEKPLTGDIAWEILWFGLIFDVAVLFVISVGLVVVIDRYWL